MTIAAAIPGRRPTAPATRIAVRAVLFLLLLCQCHGRATGQATDRPATRTALPQPLVYLRDIDPSIIQDIRYAGADNFTGAPVPGYSAPECILTRRTAETLSAVQGQVRSLGFSLKVYDCYRPLRSVAAFMRWTRSAGGPSTSAYHPSVPRHRLVAFGYIAAQSGHSRGHAVDLTLVALPRRPVAESVPGQTFDVCTASVDKRAPDDGLDMGTAFDCFDKKSQTVTSAITAEQDRNRRRLATAMSRAGFVPLRQEWWHFSLPAGDPGRSFDIEIVKRGD